MKNPKKNLAAIDIGTNSFHLVIAEVNTETGRFKILGKEKEMVRLGSGSTDMKYLSEAVMSRGIAVLKRFRTVADAFHADVRAIATSAVREAANKQEFFRRVKMETGIRMEIVSGPEEARLIYLGVLQALPVFPKKILLIDIGGGSTEFLIGEKRSICFSNSLKLGAVRLSERFFYSGTLSKQTIDECRKFIRGSLAPIVRDIKKRQFDVCIGTSGTINNLANIIRANRGEATDLSLNNVSFSKAELLGTVKNILALPTPTERIEIDGIDPSRADIIPAGAIILEQIVLALGLRILTVSEYSLREGILLDSIEKMHTKKPSVYLHNLRRSSVLHLAENYRYEKKHAYHVTGLALQLFDQTKYLHKLNEQAREYLEAAAILHEVGLFVSHAQHHRHSYYLIRNAELFGYTENEKEIIANVARYHRKSHPKVRHEEYNLLSNEDRILVSKLAALLRIADGLDRSHASHIRHLKVRKIGRKLRIRIFYISKVCPDLELWGANRKKQLFENVYHKKIEFVIAR
jgi:exopolyphosphatase/guanosine-5'-triphosphate,3'-diphosphate pyrophosphatase